MLNPKYGKTFKSAYIKVIVQTCFTNKQLDPLIVCNKRGIKADEYKDIIYDGLFSLIDNFLKSLEVHETICSANKNIFIFMQDNTSCHKLTYIFKFLAKNYIPVIE